MSSIKEHIETLQAELNQMQLDGHITQPNEYVDFKDVDLAVNKLRKTCEQTKDIERQ